MSILSILVSVSLMSILVVSKRSTTSKMVSKCLSPLFWCRRDWLQHLGSVEMVSKTSIPNSTEISIMSKRELWVHQDDQSKSLTLIFYSGWVHQLLIFTYYTDKYGTLLIIYCSYNYFKESKTRFLIKSSLNNFL